MSTSQCNKNHEDVISHLRDILSNIHYSTKRCNNCGWVDHEDEKGWHECEKCSEQFCGECKSEEHDCD